MKRAFASIVMACISISLLAQVKFTISPPKYEFFVSTGETKTFTVTVNNLGDSVMHVKVYPSDWTLDFDGRIRFLPPGSVKNSCSGWLYINPQEFNIDANTFTDIRVTMNVPDNAYGDYWSLLFVESSPVMSIERPGVSFNSRLGCVLYSTINGTFSMNGEITSMSFNKKQNSLSAGFSNTGNIHLRVKGFMQIQRDSNIIYEKNLSEILVLPGTDRTIDFPVDTDLKKGEYTVRVHLDYGGSEILEGEKRISVD